MAPGALLPRRLLGDLLGQQLVKLQPLPGGVAAVLQACQVCIGWRMVQPLQRLAQRQQARRQQVLRHHLGQRHAGHGAGHHLAQIGLRQLRHGRVDRRQRAGQRRAGIHRLECRMHHLAPEKPSTHLAADAQPGAGRHRLLLRRVKVQEAQQQLAAVVGQPHQQLATRAQLDPGVQHLALDLRRLALAHRRDRGQPGFVLVAQRQVQGQVDVAAQAEFFQRPLWC